MIISSRFNGPDGSANGGYTCGKLSLLLDEECVEVTLRLPPPLDKDLDLRREGGVVELLDGDQTVAVAKPGELDMEIPEPPTWAQTLAASERYAGHSDHPFPHCFVCGPGRDPGDGLRIFAGPVEGSELVASSWIPAPELGDAEGVVRPEFLWCALDCPGAFAVDQGTFQPRVLGRFTAQVFHRPKVEEQLRVIGWPLGTQRRKAFAGTAVVDSSDRVCAAARAVWIALS